MAWCVVDWGKTPTALRASPPNGRNQKRHLEETQGRLDSVSLQSVRVSQSSFFTFSKFVFLQAVSSTFKGTSSKCAVITLATFTLVSAHLGEAGGGLDATQATL